jgi:hypothetical protein
MTRCAFFLSAPANGSGMDAQRADRFDPVCPHISRTALSGKPAVRPTNATAAPARCPDRASSEAVIRSGPPRPP